MKIGIIGGKGNMGQWMKQFLEDNNFKVIISDLDTELTNKELIKQSVAVIYSVPIGKTAEIIEETIEYTNENQILLDLTSIKSPSVNAMLKSKAEVLGLHPMFSHNVEDVKGQTIIMCKARTKDKTKIFEDLFLRNQIRIKESNPEQHDKIMANIQGLTHFNAIVLSNVLMKLGVNIKESLDYTSPIYKMRMDMIGRILGQDPRLYAEIEIHNPYTLKSVEQLRDSAHELIRHIEAGDVEGFIEYFDKGSDYLGNFTKEAMEESNYLIKKMSERTKGGKKK